MQTPTAEKTARIYRLTETPYDGLGEQIIHAEGSMEYIIERYRALISTFTGDLEVCEIDALTDQPVTNEPF